MVGGSFRVPAGTGVRLLLARTIVAEVLPLPDGCRLTPLAWQGSTWSARSAQREDERR